MNRRILEGIIRKTLKEAIQAGGGGELFVPVASERHEQTRIFGIFDSFEKAKQALIKLQQYDVELLNGLTPGEGVTGNDGINYRIDTFILNNPEPDVYYGG